MSAHEMNAPDRPVPPVPPTRVSEPPRANLLRRVLTAAILTPAVVALMYLAPKWGFIALLYVAAAVSASELFAMVVREHRHERVVGVLATVALCHVLIFSASDPRISLTLLLATALVPLLTVLARPVPVETAHLRAGWLLATPVYVGGTLAALGTLHMRPGNEGPGWVLLAMMLAWASDTGGYFAGRAFGRRPLYPVVSPKKTIEGSLGGALGGVVGAVGASV